jgi:hypothetical protein
MLLILRRVRRAPGRRTAFVVLVAIISLGFVVVERNGSIAVVGADQAPAVSPRSAPTSTPSMFVGVEPVRLLDTRIGLGLGGTFRSRQPRRLQVSGAVDTSAGRQVAVPLGATAVVLNVTSFVPSHDGFISVRPLGTTTPVTTSNLNFRRHDISANAVVVALSGEGEIEVTFDAYGTNGAVTDVLIDLVGYFVPAGTLSPDPPTVEPDPGPEIYSLSVRTGTPLTFDNAVGIEFFQRVGLGTYVVDVVQPVANCAIAATAVGRTGDPPPPTVVTATVGAQNASRITLRVWNLAGEPTNGTTQEGFDLLVVCPA